jgi:hypothetical protein
LKTSNKPLPARVGAAEAAVAKEMPATSVDERNIIAQVKLG